MLIKILGYSLGAMFIALLLAPIGVSIWLIYDRINVLTSTTTEQARIEKCASQRKKNNTSWVPVAVTATGNRIQGEMGWAKQEWCESDIGKTVSVYVHKTDPNMQRINTFFQFWMLPVIFTVFCLVFYPGSYLVKKRRKKQKNTQTGGIELSTIDHQ